MTKEELNRIYEYIEPHVSGGVAHVRLTAEMAIAYMKKYVKQYYPYRLDEVTDEQLLQEFIIINWAYPLKEVIEEDDTRTT